MALLHSVTPEKLLFDEINGLTENTFLDWLQQRNFQDSFRRLDVFMSYKNYIGIPWEDIIEAIPLDDFKNYIQALRDQGYVGRFGSVIPPEKFSLYFPSSQVLYRWIPKNACTSVKKLFIQGEPESIDLKVREHRFHETVQERFGVEQSIIIQNSGFTTVAIIRDPILRIISCYLDKFALPVVDNRPFEGFIKDHIKRYIQLNRIDRSEDESISFAEFLDYIESTPLYLHNIHWMPQSSFLPKDFSDVILIPIDSIAYIPNLINSSKLGVDIPRCNVKGNLKSTLSDRMVDHEHDNFSQKSPKYLDRKSLTSHAAFADILSITKIKRLYKDDFRLYDIALKTEF